MSKSIKSILAVSLLAVVAACGSSGGAEEEVFIEPAPVTEEPEFTGKF